LFRAITGAGFRAVKAFAKNTLARFQERDKTYRERGRFFAKQRLAFTARQETVSTFARRTIKTGAGYDKL